MFCTDCAALSGRVTTKKISNATATKPMIFLTFTRTTVPSREDRLRLCFYSTTATQGIRHAVQ